MAHTEKKTGEICYTHQVILKPMSFPSVLYARQTLHNPEIHPLCLQSNNPIRLYLNRPHHLFNLLHLTRQLNVHLFFLIAL